MIVLGICDSQDAGAALLVDGRLVAAVNEERLNRIKLWGGVPRESISAVLKIAALEPRDVDAVVLGSAITPNILARLFRGAHQPLRRWNGQFRYLLSAFITYQTVARKLRLPLAAEAAAARLVLARELRALGIEADLHVVDHHVAHAYGAFATSGFDRTLVLTADGLGDGLAVTVSVGERGKGLTLLHEETGYSALTLYYSRLTELLGYTAVRDEGKVNALAAHDDTYPALEEARRILWHENGRLSTQNHLLPRSPRGRPYSALAKFSREEIASSFQKNLEEVLTDYLRHWLRRTGCDHVALAGGAFANVKLNQRLAAMPEVHRIYVMPHMGDGGLSIGGAEAFLRSPPEPLPDVFLGPEFTNYEIRAALEEAGVTFRGGLDIELEVAKLLAQGKTVARFDGRMECGPRALGNRSILAPATDPDTINWLNRKLKRNPIMPFAPVIHEDEFDSCIIGGGKARHASQFMTISFDVTPRMRELAPGAVHVDATARPQRVTRAAHPALARILEEYTRLSGLPALINTSLNMHEEPIVCRPEEAIGAWRQARLDALAIGPYLAVAPPSTSAEG